MDRKDRTIEMLSSLRGKLEDTCKRKMRTPKDFYYLEKCIFLHTHQMVNASTLKRLFGYIGGVASPRESTLDILCQYVGYKNWQAFVSKDCADLVVDSTPIVCDHLYSDELIKGEQIHLIWNPNRSVLIQYEGSAYFVVLKSVNSKLLAGMRFRCHVFIQDEPLFITDLVGFTNQPVDYVCGKSDGIKFFLD